MNESIAEVDMDLNVGVGYISSDLSDLSDSDVDDDDPIERASIVELKLTSQIELGDKGSIIASTSSFASVKAAVVDSTSIAADFRNYGRDPSSRSRQCTITSANSRTSKATASASTSKRRLARSKGKRVRSVEIESSEDEIEVGVQFERKRTRSNRSYDTSASLVRSLGIDDILSVGTKEDQLSGGEFRLVSRRNDVDGVPMDVRRESIEEDKVVASVIEGRGSLEVEELEVGLLSINEIFRSRVELEENHNAEISCLANLDSHSHREKKTLSTPIFSQSDSTDFPMQSKSPVLSQAYHTPSSSVSSNCFLPSPQESSTPFFNSPTLSSLPSSPISESNTSATISSRFASSTGTTSNKTSNDTQWSPIFAYEDQDSFQSSFDPRTFPPISLEEYQAVTSSPSISQEASKFNFVNIDASHYIYPKLPSILTSPDKPIFSSCTMNVEPLSQRFSPGLTWPPSKLPPLPSLPPVSFSDRVYKPFGDPILPPVPPYQSAHISALPSTSEALREPVIIYPSKFPPTKPRSPSPTTSEAPRVAVPIYPSKVPPSKLNESFDDYFETQNKYKFAPLRVVPLPPNALLQAATFLSNPRNHNLLPQLTDSTVGGFVDPEVARLALEKKLLKREKDKLRVKKEFKADKRGWIKPETLKLGTNGMPPLWCQGRQELCESLPYFKAYQGGHYDRDEICHGYLLDGFPAPMDRCEHGGLVIVSHGGGCSDPSPLTPTYQLIADQDRENIRVRALINCFNSGTPIVLIAGKNYTHFPWLGENGIRYAVLGYYLVTSYWAEGEPIEIGTRKHGQPDYFVRYKFRFEWQPSQGEPWFSKLITSKLESLSMEHLSIESSYSESNIQLTSCITCQKIVPSVYIENISCYDDLCPNFFKINGIMIHPSKLHCIPNFLKPIQSSSWEQLAPLPLLPQSLEDTPTSSVSAASRQQWKAFHCRKCGRLSSKAAWDRLICASEGCDALVTLESKVYTATEKVRRDLRQQAFVEAGIKITQISHMDNFAGVTIHLTEDVKIHHLWSKDGEPKDADRLFEMYQEPAAAALLKRNAMSTHRVAGQLLCNHYSFNAGELYKYCVKVDTVPLDQAPQCVQISCEMLRKISAACVKIPSRAHFNEVLSVAYMEGGKMSYHDDGEAGLGPIVSTLSLGSRAVMSFRAKTKKSKQIQLPRGSAKHAKVIVKLDLHHGDITIMEHEDLQKHYEHQVEPVGPLRFAATARYIAPTIKPNLR